MSSAETERPPPEPGSAAAVDAIGPGRLFVTFSKLALSGFGGVLPFAYRALVERQRWLEPREFAGLLAIAQVMPGPTICNLSVMIGQRFAGLAGACAALAGMVAGPLCLVIALGVLWQRFGAVGAVKAALAGMTAVAVGLILSTAVKMGIALFKRTAKPGPVDAPAATQEAYWTVERCVQVLLCALGFVGVGVLRWPLAAVVAGLAPIAIGIAWWVDPERTR